VRVSRRVTGHVVGQFAFEGVGEVSDVAQGGSLTRAFGVGVLRRIEPPSMLRTALVTRKTSLTPAAEAFMRSAVAYVQERRDESSAGGRAGNR